MYYVKQSNLLVDFWHMRGHLLGNRMELRDQIREVFFLVTRLYPQKMDSLEEIALYDYEQAREWVEIYEYIII